MSAGLILNAAASSGDIPNWFAVVMGIGTVFVGLICIVIICKIMSFLCRSRSNEVAEGNNVPVANENTVIENRQELIAAVSAVAAEELGTDVSAIRITSFKKI